MLASYFKRHLEARPLKTSLHGSIALIVIAGTLLFPSTAAAYVGPGAGLSVIGSLLALIAAVILAIVGFIWYPLKRMTRKRKAKTIEDDS